MRVIICGSREWKDWLTVSERLSELPSDAVIVHGAARGADSIAGDVAMGAGMWVESCPANWSAHGKSAGPIRNAAMVAMGADLCIAFWDGKSVGTKDMMDRCERAGIPVEVIRAE